MIFVLKTDEMSTNYATLVVLALFGPLWVVANTIYVLRRHKEPIHSRGWELTLFGSCYGMFFFAIIAGVSYATENNILFNCHLIIWPACLFIPFCIAPPILRSWVLFFNFFSSLQLLKGRTFLEKKANWFLRHRWTATNSTMFAVLGVITVLSICMNCIIVYTAPWMPPSDLFVCTYNIVYLIIVQGAICAFVVVIFVIALWRVHDVFGLKLELQLYVLILLPIFIFWVILNTLNEPLEPFISAHLIFIAIFASLVVSVVLPTYWTYRDEARASAVDSGRYAWENPEILRILGINPVVTTPITSGRKPSSDRVRVEPEQFLRAALRNAILLQELESFAVQSWCVENVVFYLDLQTFRADLAADAGQGPDKLMQAKRIYNTYLAPECDMLLNVDQQVRDRARHLLDLAEKEPEQYLTSEIFSEVETQVFHQILTDTLRNWQASPRFQVALHKLKERGMASTLYEPDLTVDEIRVRVVVAQNRKQSNTSAFELALTPPRSVTASSSYTGDSGSLAALSMTNDGNFPVSATSLSPIIARVQDF